MGRKQTRRQDNGPLCPALSRERHGQGFSEAVFCRRLFIREALSLLSHALPAASRAIPGFLRECASLRLREHNVYGGCAVHVFLFPGIVIGKGRGQSAGKRGRNRNICSVPAVSEPVFPQPQKRSAGKGGLLPHWPAFPSRQRSAWACGIDTAGGTGYSPAAYNDQFYQYQRGRGNWGQLLFA